MTNVRSTTIDRIPNTTTSRLCYHNRGYVKMKIFCYDMAEFLDVCAGLVARGITFEAKSGTLEVHCTGGY